MWHSAAWLFGVGGRGLMVQPYRSPHLSQLARRPHDRPLCEAYCWGVVGRRWCSAPPTVYQLHERGGRLGLRPLLYPFLALLEQDDRKGVNYLTFWRGGGGVWGSSFPPVRTPVLQGIWRAYCTVYMLVVPFVVTGSCLFVPLCNKIRSSKFSFSMCTR